jgi:molybdopterin-containing oxidoreductase family iron-sulfur binding subunit
MQYAASLRSAVTTGTLARRAARGRQAVDAQAASPIESTQGDYYFLTYSSPVFGDGRGANKPWLQELPDPVSKICWQSWIEVHPETARQLGVSAGDHITVETASGSVTAPAYIYLGVRRDTVAMPLGQGHTAYGRYARGIGVNALDAQPATFDARGGSLVKAATKARVSRAGAHSALVTTEGSARQHGREIARAVAAADLPALTGRAALPTFIGDAAHEYLPGLRSPVANDAQGELGDPLSNEKGMYDPQHWAGMTRRRWAMTVDLARCTGCSACVTACYAENNIPTVGAPWQVGILFPDRTGPGANILRSREMAWIRLERYFEGGEHGEADFETRFLPMMCQHCGNAPCEPVCPVFATYHAPDGLNVQVYNRCVGTRYCSNNCPYKVRTFNWFGYGEKSRPHYAFPEPLNWQLNPDVTVRGKGVMEKCTFCVQRIRDAENRARLEGREIAADEFTTACAQGCPSRAIIFGDASDPGWAVTRGIDDRRRYHVFEELNTYPAVIYLQKVLHNSPVAAAGAPAPAAGAPGGPGGN